MDYRDLRIADTSPTEYGEFANRNRDGGFHSHGGTPIAGCFFSMENHIDMIFNSVIWGSPMT